MSEPVRGDELPAASEPPLESASETTPEPPEPPGGDTGSRAAPGAQRDWTEPVACRPATVALVAVAIVPVMVWGIGPRAELAAFCYLGVVGVVLSFIDIALHRLPDPLTLPSYPIGAALLGVAVPFTDDGGTRYLHALAGLCAMLLLYFVQWFIVPNAIGFGDVKLSGVLGLYLGWLGWPAWILGLFAAFVLGGVWAVGLLITRRADRKSAIPFGPFMLVGVLVAVVRHGPGI
ncbi:prepilin peptidase [Actinomadura alba]|uniref:Prepilin peptidase n=1 Tax=Actinomadura alba TaxID=406431 RepID=A0ABR7LM99_9ACTN|nr:A24 family peptidase [Actinomadura alba]MBC6465523.1 prepilin peptidase [Actinomadura alba]